MRYNVVHLYTRNPIMLITLKDIVSDSSSNLAGKILFSELEKGIEFKEDLIVIVENDALLSSSFLNSSIGEFLDKYGVDTFKNKVKIKGTRTQFNRIVDYLNKYSQLSIA